MAGRRQGEDWRLQERHDDGETGETVMGRQERHDDGETGETVMGRQERRGDGETGETQ